MAGNQELQTNTNNDLSLLISKNELDKANELDNKVSILLNSGLSGIALSLAKTSVVQELNKYISSDIMSPIMQMQNKKYGFKTDSKTGYSQEVVKDCIIEALLRGLEPTGNEFNIIGGNMYSTKEGCAGVLARKLNCATELVYGISKKDTTTNITSIDVEIIWFYDNKKDSKVLTFPVKVYEGVTTEEAIRGKAERKALAWLIKKITGIPMPEGDIDRSVDGFSEDKKQTKTEAIKKMVSDNNSKIEEVEVVEIKKEEKVEVNKEEKIEITPDRQKRFDDYVSKSKSLDELIKRGNDVANNYKCKLKDLNLTIYNETMVKLQQD